MVIFLFLELKEGFLFEGEFLFKLFLNVGFFVVDFIDFGLELFVLCFELSDFKFKGLVFTHECHVLSLHVSGGDFGVFEISLVMVRRWILVGAVFKLLNSFTVAVLARIG